VTLAVAEFRGIIHGIEREQLHQPSLDKLERVEQVAVDLFETSGLEPEYAGDEYYEPSRDDKWYASLLQFEAPKVIEAILGGKTA